jgi:hypothetical protein
MFRPDVKAVCSRCEWKTPWQSEIEETGLHVQSMGIEHFQSTGHDWRPVIRYHEEEGIA